jgi:hypothetical protein
MPPTSFLLILQADDPKPKNYADLKLRDFGLVYGAIARKYGYLEGARELF